MKNLRKRTEGFTIIEVMIVLVIAAVILLIVFLAVPALQRNSKNNQRKSDVSRIAAAVAEYASNSAGALPDNNTDINSYIGSLSFYGTGNPPVLPSAAIVNATDGQNVTDSGSTPVVAKQASCNTDGSANTTGASGRAFVVLFAVETGGDDTAQCVAG